MQRQFEGLQALLADDCPIVRATGEFCSFAALSFLLFSDVSSAYFLQPWRVFAASPTPTGS